MEEVPPRSLQDIIADLDKNESHTLAMMRLWRLASKKTKAESLQDRPGAAELLRRLAAKKAKAKLLLERTAPDFSTPEACSGAAAGGEEEEVPREQSALEKEAAADSDSSISSEVSSDSGSEESAEEGLHVRSLRLVRPARGWRR